MNSLLIRTVLIVSCSTAAGCSTDPAGLDALPEQPSSSLETANPPAPSSPPPLSTPVERPEPVNANPTDDSPSASGTPFNPPSTAPTQPDSSTQPTTEIGSASAGESTQEPPDLSAELYDPDHFPRFDIELPPTSIDALNLVTSDTDPQQDIYVSAHFEYAGERLENVGIRIKGEGSFQRLDGKPAWKIKFDEFVEGQSFRGLKRMALNNLFEDPSFIAERLAYDVYRAAGVPAPRCNNARVYVNGIYYGVYANVEAEDKAFLRRWFPDAGGNLYEEGQSDFVPGAESAFDLETNELANDRTDLATLIAALHDATTAETFLDDMGRYLDVENFLHFTALEAAVNQWDMYSYTVFWVNNLRLYNDPRSGKFHFIPWGHDLSMKPYRDSGKPYIRLFELARQYDRPQGPISSGLLFQRCLESAACVDAYRAAVEDVIAIYASLNLEQRAASYYQQVKSAVHEDERKNVCCGSPAALSNEGFEAGYRSVTETIRGRIESLREDLDSAR